MTILCLVKPQAFFDMLIDIKIWYGHGSRSTSIYPKPSIVTLLNIQG
jgi:hypothetical protein